MKDNIDYISAYNHMAVALHVTNSDKHKKEAIISARPKSANITGLHIKNLIYLVKGQITQGNKVVIRNMRIKRADLFDLSDKLDIFRPNIEFLASITD